MKLIDLDATDLSLAGGFILFAGVVSLVLQLKLEAKLLWAALRTVLQLLLIGVVLKEVFALQNPALIGGVCVVMFAVAAHAAIGRSSRTVRGLYIRTFGSLVLTGSVTILLVTKVIIGATPWYTPQYLIPLLGMILGNSLTGISLCLDHVLESFKERRHEVELELSLGATAWEAARGPVRDAVRRGMIPILNAMAVVGLVSLPGMMTGQILGGVTPLIAVKYQILVMFMLAGAVSLGCILITLLVYKQLFTDRHQLASERIHPKT